MYGIFGHRLRHGWGCEKWLRFTDSSQTTALRLALVKSRRLSANSSGVDGFESMQELVRHLRHSKIIKSDRIAEALIKVDRKDYIFGTSANVEELGSPYSLNFKPVNPKDSENTSPIENPADQAIQLELLEPWLKPGNNILDCGSGSGYLSAAMATMAAKNAEKPCGNVVALDRRADFINDCVKRIVGTIQKSKVDASVLEHIFAICVDATDDLLFPHAPYHAIRVGFSMPNSGCETAKFLLRQLRRGGRMISHIHDEDRLLIFDKDEDSANVKIHHSTSALRYPPALLQKKVLLMDDPEISASDIKRAREKESERQQERAEVMSELQKWRQEFERKTNRRPTRKDLESDAIARNLFARFQRLNE